MGVFTKPGLINVTLTPYLFIIKYKDSVKLIKAAFDAPYPEIECSPLYQAVDPTTAMCPLFLVLK